jgi:hypothetical protein
MVYMRLDGPGAGRGMKDRKAGALVLFGIGNADSLFEGQVIYLS